MIPREVEDSLSDFFQTSLNKEFFVHSSNPLTGGSINDVYCVETIDGDFCLKINEAAKYPGMFEKEAMGLSILQEANEIRVPKVITTGNAGTYSYILMEYIDGSYRMPDFMRDFGYSLASLHRHYGESFGLDHDNYMGSLEQVNKMHDSWIVFFTEERLERQFRKARSAGYFSSGETSNFYRLYKQLDNICPHEKPSLIHGDLWDGNFIVSDEGKACLIDPAVYYGHREVDIAMSMLFGGFDDDFYDAYNESFPMEKGWRKRVEVYNLYPLLIHLNLFGPGYLGAIQTIIRKF